MRDAMHRVGADVAAQKKMNVYAEEAISALSELDLDPEKRMFFADLVSSVMKRSS